MEVKIDLCGCVDKGTTTPSGGVTKEYVDNLIAELKNKEDKDTIFDPTELISKLTELSNKVTTLESKTDSDSQTLSLDGNTLTISNGNSITLPQFNNKPNEDRFDNVETKTIKDTGWRKISSDFLADGYIKFRRIGDVVYFALSGGQYDTFTVKSKKEANAYGYKDGRAIWSNIAKIIPNFSLPKGIRSPVPVVAPIFKDIEATPYGFAMLHSFNDANTVSIRLSESYKEDTPTVKLRSTIVSYVTSDPYPTEEIGEAI